MSSINKTSKIFVRNADFSMSKIAEDKETIRLIDETVKKQLEVLKLKELDKERLRMVVQL
jgi:hypothetical protein